MSEQKSHHFRPPLYHHDGSSRPSAKPKADPQSEQKGWDAYRKWLSSVSGKARNERTPIDHSIYSWKGYQNWADRIRQSWKNDNSEP
jgi:hypothetical protein